MIAELRTYPSHNTLTIFTAGSLTHTISAQGAQLGGLNDQWDAIEVIPPEVLLSNAAPVGREWTSVTYIRNASLGQYSHFGHQFEAHRLERLILGHNGYGSGICGIVAELKVHASWWSAHKVATILWQAQNLLLNLRFIGMSNPGGRTIASAALSLNECLLLLVEWVENSLEKCTDKYGLLESGVLLTLSLTVSLILLPALLMADDRNEPKCLACCVTFVVTNDDWISKYY